MNVLKFKVSSDMLQKVFHIMFFFCAHLDDMEICVRVEIHQLQCCKCNAAEWIQVMMNLSNSYRLQRSTYWCVRPRAAFISVWLVWPLSFLLFFFLWKDVNTLHLCRNTTRLPSLKHLSASVSLNSNVFWQQCMVLFLIATISLVKRCCRLCSSNLRCAVMIFLLVKKSTFLSF